MITLSMMYHHTFSSVLCFKFELHLDFACRVNAAAEYSVCDHSLLIIKQTK